MTTVGLDDLIPPGNRSPAGTLNRVELRRRVTAVAAFIAAHGGDWLLHEPDPFWFAAYLYGVVLGGGGVTLLPDVRPGTLSAIGEAYQGQLGTAAVAANHVPSSSIFATVGDSPALPAVPAGTVTVLTSGTTGDRKHLVRGVDQLLSEAMSLQRNWPAGDQLVFASMVSHHHMYGLSFGIVWPLASGACLLVARQTPVPDFATLDNSAGKRVRLITSPTYLHRLQSSLELAGFSDKQGRTVAIDRVFSAGAPLDPDKAAWASKHLGCPVNEIYGSSETGAVATRRAGTDMSWEALPDADLQVEDGRLLIDVRYLARNLARPFLSPDRVEADGASFRLLGRADRVVKVEGKRVSLQQIEDAVLGLDWVETCAAVLMDGEHDRIAVAVVPRVTGLELLRREGKPAMDRRVRQVLSHDLEAVTVPRRFRYLAAIPASPEGKVDKEKLRAVFADDARLRPSVHAVTKTGEGVELDLALDPDLLAFQGHFPERAILPGVALLHWVMLFAHEFLGTPLHTGLLPSIKFTSTLAPKDWLQLRLSRHNGELEYRCGYAGGTASKGRIKIDG